LLESEKKHTEEVIAIREKQIGDFIVVDQPATESVSQRVAMDIEEALDDAIDDFDADIRQIKRMYAEIVSERQQIQKLEVNLAARKKWLEEHKK
jgi:septal ring factor EnvC (AmiA/AmiB activator)